MTTKLQLITESFARAGSGHKQATVAPFECSLLFAQDKKPHNIGEMIIKLTCIKMAEIMCGPQEAHK